MFLLVPERQPLRFKKPVVKRTVVAVRKFMNIMIVLALFRAALVSCVLYFCGVPLILAASLAILSFWLYFIPTVGSLISFALPVPIALLLPDLTSSARWCACIFHPLHLPSSVILSARSRTGRIGPLGSNCVVVFSFLVFRGVPLEQCWRYC